MFEYILVKTMIWTHIITGAIALLLGLINSYNLKGSKTHKKIGRWFFWLLLINATLGILLAIFNRPDSGYIATFSIIIVLMVSGLGDFILRSKHQNRLNLFFAIAAGLCLYYSFSIIAATNTELPLMTLRVYCITAIIAFLCASELHRNASHAMKMQLSLIIAFSGMGNNSLTWLISKYHNSIFVIAVLITVFPFHIYQLSKKAKIGK